jgi:mannose-6-phosphate isomerase-like protein (cupin superfamily)
LKDLIKNIADLHWTSANHEEVYKKIIFTGEVFESNITQVAFTELNMNIEVSEHIHETMEEVFFLVEGICEFKIDKNTYELTHGSFIRIPVNTEHSLRAITNCKLFYFGVSI